MFLHAKSKRRALRSRRLHRLSGKGRGDVGLSFSGTCVHRPAWNRRKKILQVEYRDWGIYLLIWQASRRPCISPPTLYVYYVMTRTKRLCDFFIGNSRMYKCIYNIYIYISGPARKQRESPEESDLQRFSLLCKSKLNNSKLMRILLRSNLSKSKRITRKTKKNKEYRSCGSELWFFILK